MTRTYLVTGSASGIGAATVDYLRARGAHVIGVDRHKADIAVDLATNEGRAELVARTRDLTHGKLDAVIACAGVGLLDPVTMKVNYFGAVATLEGLRPLLAAGTDPRAAVVSSFAALLPSDPQLVEAALAGDESTAIKIIEEAIAQGDSSFNPYSSAKYALNCWVRRQAITEQWAGAGIALNAIAPGTTVTPFIQAMLDTPEGQAQIDSSVPMPLNGHATPQQVAPLLSWLTSPENTHVTAQIIFIDGGADAVVCGDRSW
ncbi:SDR family oxidoreductase [Nocardia goodfellowii]